ncbi:MAG TPA: hypothetical protein VHL31_12430 [Geminicoccus sp.]|nr:hypothetical protein [Geminicoccus sp.]
MAGDPGWAGVLEASALGMMMRESLFLYPLANLVHLLGLSLLIAPIGLLDLRLLGFGRVVSVPDASRLLTPWTAAGLFLLIASGLMLFSADAGPLVATDVFQLKMLLLALNLANVAVFRFLWRGHLQDWDRRPPLIGRLQAVLSLAGWLLIGSLGRLIAYG